MIRNKKNTFEDWFVYILIFLIVIFIGYLVYNAYGHITQDATITINVVNKDIQKIVTQSCTETSVGETKVQTCTPVTNYYYYVYSENETFHTSEGLYQAIVINKKHTFYVTGWPGHSRYIHRILE